MVLCGSSDVLQAGLTLHIAVTPEMQAVCYLEVCFCLIAYLFWLPLLLLIRQLEFRKAALPLKEWLHRPEGETRTLNTDALAMGKGMVASMPSFVSLHHQRQPETFTHTHTLILTHTHTAGSRNKALIVLSEGVLCEKELGIRIKPHMPLCLPS